MLLFETFDHLFQYGITVNGANHDFHHLCSHRLQTDDSRQQVGLHAYLLVAHVRDGDAVVRHDFQHEIAVKIGQRAATGSQVKHYEGEPFARHGIHHAATEFLLCSKQKRHNRKQKAKPNAMQSRGE